MCIITSEIALCIQNSLRRHDPMGVIINTTHMSIYTPPICLYSYELFITFFFLFHFFFFWRMHWINGIMDNLNNKDKLRVPIQIWGANDNTLYICYINIYIIGMYACIVSMWLVQKLKGWRRDWHGEFELLH